MVDGSALLASFLYGLRAAGAWQDERGTNVLDGGAPFYDTYATADGRHMAVGALEPKFYAELLDRLGLDGAGLPAQYDRSGWPELRARLTEAFAGRTQAQWVEVFAGSDACVAPVVSPREAPGHPHNAARNTFIDVGGVTQPAPAPRFGRTACGPPSPPARPGADTNDVLAGLGFSAAEIASLRDNGAAI
jgi:alpha-methylacyl-CoA racemase